MKKKTYRMLIMTLTILTILLFLDLVFSGTEGFEYKNPSITEYGEMYRNHTIKVGKSIFVIKKETARNVRYLMSELYYYLFGLFLFIWGFVFLVLLMTYFSEGDGVVFIIFLCNMFVYLLLSITTVSGIDSRKFFFIPALIFDVLLLGLKLIEFIKLNYNKVLLLGAKLVGFIKLICNKVLLLGMKLIDFIKINYNNITASKYLNIFKLRIFEKIKNKRLKKKIIRKFEDTL